MDVVLFPRKDIDAKVCSYRHGKTFAVEFNTDAGVKGYTEFQLFQAFKYGLKYTLFSNSYNPGGANSISNIDYVNNVGTGLVELQHYFSTDRWVNPINGLDQIIPDYYSSTWTSLGASVFNVTPGQSKPTLYPNHGQELYDVSDGDYGYDAVNQIMGDSGLSEFIGIKNAFTTWTDELGLERASSFSYRNGRNTTPSIYKLAYLGGRNSNRLSSFVYYGKSFEGQPLGNDLPLSRVAQVNKQETTRWVDAAHNVATANQLIRNGINLAHSTNGLYGDFSHFHNSGSNELLENLFKTAGEHLDTNGLRNECWIAGYGELTEYFWFRELIKRAVATTLGLKVYITLEWENLDTSEDGISDSVLTQMLKTPLSIEIDISDTILAGKNIKSSGGKILRLGSDRYIVDFPFGRAVEGIKCIVIEEGEGDYYPIAETTYTKTISGNNVTITTNNKVKAVLFDTETDIYEIRPVTYYNSLKTAHQFQFDSSRDNYIGIVDEIERTQLITV